MCVCVLVQTCMEMLGLVQEILPLITGLVTMPRQPRVSGSRDDDDDDANDNTVLTAECSDESRPGLTPSAADRCHRHYAIVESDHPYKPAAVHNYRVPTDT